MKAAGYRALMVSSWLAVIAVVGGCDIGQANSTDTRTPTAQAGVYQPEWLDSANGNQINIPHLAQATLTDNGTRAIFETDCNTVQATLANGAVTEVMVTEMACGNPTPFQDALIDYLNSDGIEFVDSSQFIVGNIQYTWRVPVGETTPYTGALVDGEYQGTLTQIDGPSASPLRLATATISSGGTMASFFAGCNRLRAPITDSGLGAIASTRMACPDESNETLLLEHLNSGHFVRRSERSFIAGDVVFNRIN